MIGGKGDNIVLITGMGRSGTSIFARWLSEIGFNFGTGLNKTVNASGSVRSSTDTQHINPTGNFEDAGLMSLHVDLYKKNKMRSWLDVPLGYEWQIPFEQAAVFRNYMSQFNVTNGPVAVKNPLATSFLVSWEQALPGITVLAVYRDRSASIDSVVRLRQRNQYNRRNKLAGIINQLRYKWSASAVKSDQYKALRAWIRCNQECLDFYNSDIPSVQPMIINAELWMQDDGHRVFDELSRRFSHLKYVSVSSLLKDGFFTKEPPWYPEFSELESRAVSIERALVDADIHRN